MDPDGRNAAIVIGGLVIGAVIEAVVANTNWMETLGWIEPGSKGSPESRILDNPNAILSENGSGTANEAPSAGMAEGDEGSAEAAGCPPGADSRNWSVPQEAKEKIPADWGEGEPNRRGEGRRWQDPNDKGSGVRIDKGNRDNSQPSQQVDHVVVRDRGRVIGSDGRPIRGSIKENPSQAHIPLSTWINWSRWNKP